MTQGNPVDEAMETEVPTPIKPTVYFDRQISNCRVTEAKTLPLFVNSISDIGNGVF
jgi:hypothetical protein